MKKHKILSIIFILALTLPFAYGGCGGGGGGGGGDDSSPVRPSGEIPTITSVLFYKYINNGTTPINTLIYNIGDLANVEINAFDHDMDMSTLSISEYLLPNLDTPYFENISMVLPTQSSSSMNYFLIEPTTIAGPAGNWRICFWIVDATGNESPEFCVNVVINDDTSKQLRRNMTSNDIFGMSGAEFDAEAE